MRQPGGALRGGVRDALRGVGLLAQLCGVLACLSAAQPAEAQTDGTHYQTLIVGDRSMGMGTAFTGLANDGSAVYYNPGGLSFREGAAISGGFWLNAFDDRTMTDGLRRTFGNYNLSSSRRPSFPAFAFSSIGIGKKDDEGKRRFVAGISSFRVGEHQVASHVEMLNPEVDLPETFDLAESDRTTYFGVSLAWRAKRLLGAGLSVFLSRRSFHHRETLVSLSGPAPFDIDQSVGATLNTDTSLRAYHLVLRLGLLKALTPRANVGLMVQPPGIPLKVQGSRRYQVLGYDLSEMPGEAVYTYEDFSKLEARSPVPLEVRLGTAWRVRKQWTWSHDLSFVAPIPSRRLMKGVPTGAGGDALLGLFVDPSTRRVPVVNVATGLEAAAGKHVDIEVGFFTDFSAAPRVPSQSDVYRNERLQVFGLTSSVALRGDDRGLALGFAATMGRGQGLAVQIGDRTNLEGYRRTNVRSHTIFVSLTGAVEVAEKLVRDAAKKVVPTLVESPK